MSDVIGTICFFAGSGALIDSFATGAIAQEPEAASFLITLEAGFEQAGDESLALMIAGFRTALAFNRQEHLKQMGPVIAEALKESFQIRSKPKTISPFADFAFVTAEVRVTLQQFAGAGGYQTAPLPKRTTPPHVRQRPVRVEDFDPNIIPSPARAFVETFFIGRESLIADSAMWDEMINRISADHAMAADYFQKAKASFVAHDESSARNFLILTALYFSYVVDSRKVRELAGRLSHGITKANWREWYEKGKELIATFVQVKARQWRDKARFYAGIESLSEKIWVLQSFEKIYFAFGENPNPKTCQALIETFDNLDPSDAREMFPFISALLDVFQKEPEESREPTVDHRGSEQNHTSLEPFVGELQALDAMFLHIEDERRKRSWKRIFKTIRRHWGFGQIKGILRSLTDLKRLAQAENADNIVAKADELISKLRPLERI